MASVLILLFLMYPTLISQTFKLFDWVSIGVVDESTLALFHLDKDSYQHQFYYLRDDPSIYRGSAEHFRLKLLYGI